MSLKVLLVDDEPLARLRLRSLLAECAEPGIQIEAELDQGAAVLQWLTDHACDVVLLDIRMPGMDGLALAKALKAQSTPPALVFVTAHSEHAVDAFDLEALDYLTKPVRRERLQQALQKAERWLAARRTSAAEAMDALLIHDRGRVERVPLDDILYLKAELKYVTVRTSAKAHIYDGSLSDLEARHPDRFVRVHRNALVARRAVRSIEKSPSGDDGEGWHVRLYGLDEPLAVSRRQLSALREALSAS